MTKVEVPDLWTFDPHTACLVFFRRQYVEESELYDPKKQPKPDIVIDRYAYHDLLDWIKEHERDIVKTDRTEDLKIIHRLLDVLEKVKKNEQ